MPCISSSSDEEELTCLLDVVGAGGGQDCEEKYCKPVVLKEDVNVKDILKEGNIVHQNKTREVEDKQLHEDETNGGNDGLSAMCLHDQVESLKNDICALLVERERMSETIDDFKVVGGGKEDELRAELFSCRQKLENAKLAKEQLRQLYREKEIAKEEKGFVKASKEEFERMKEEYFRDVVEAGKLEEKMRDLKHEVREANKSVLRLQQDLQIVTGRYQENQNPWQVGVPYGSTAGRSVGTERDRYGRIVDERGGESGNQRVYGKRQSRGQ